MGGGRNDGNLPQTNMTLYLAVTPDKYEFPIVVENNIHRLAEMTGSSENAIRTAASKNNRGINKGKERGKYRFYSVKV